MSLSVSAPNSRRPAEFPTNAEMIQRVHQIVRRPAVPPGRDVDSCVGADWGSLARQMSSGDLLGPPQAEKRGRTTRRSPIPV